MRAQISVIKFDQAQWQAIRYLLAWIFTTYRDLPIGVLREIVEKEFDGSLSQLRYFVRRQLRSEGYLLIEDARSLLSVTKEILNNTSDPSPEIDLALGLLVFEVDTFVDVKAPIHGRSSGNKHSKVG